MIKYAPLLPHPGLQPIVYLRRDGRLQRTLQPTGLPRLPQALRVGTDVHAPLHRLHSLSAAAQFAHSMATMLTAGLPVPKALDVTGNVISNYTFALAVQEVKQKVERGRTISESMGQIEYFPKMLTEMVGVGEQSGSLEETLDVIGEYFDNEVEVTTARLLSVLEPIITIALAVIVVVLLLAVYLPLFTLYGGM